MKNLRLIGACALSAAFLLAVPLAHATDVDGPDDCQKPHEDFGDAPECLPAYPSGVMGNFPTCTMICGPFGTMELACPPISTPPGPTGFVRHIQPPTGYWLGCYPTPGGPMGIDTETDGKVSIMPVPALAPSKCSGIPTDCVEPAFGMFFSQDECYADGSDAGITAPVGFAACAMSAVTFNVTDCPIATQRHVFLNICVDWNKDGDWNDNFACATGCAYEWAVKNKDLFLVPGCSTLTSPLFLSGPFDGPGWMRISISDDPAPPDYPWNGSVSLPGSSFRGGETEDYPVTIGHPTPARSATWGRIKTLYR